MKKQYRRFLGIVAVAALFPITSCSFGGQEKPTGISPVPTPTESNIKPSESKKPVESSSSPTVPTPVITPTTPTETTPEENVSEQYSIYLLALDSGYTGTYEEWIESIRGDEVELRVTTGYLEWKFKSEESWKKLFDLSSLQGKSAFEIYKTYHPEYTGTEEEWINSFTSSTGTSEESTYTVTFINGENKTNVTLKHNERLEEPEIDRPLGYELSCWITKSGSVWDFSKDYYPFDMELTAVYTALEFKADCYTTGGKFLGSQYFHYGDTLSLPSGYQDYYYMNEENQKVYLDSSSTYIWEKNITIYAENEINTVSNLGNSAFVAQVGNLSSNDSTIYANNLSSFYEKYQIASAEKNVSKRYVLMAEAEAELLASGVFTPVTSQGGSYLLTRQAYRSSPYALWGTDGDLMKDAIVTTDFIKASDQEALKTLYNEKKGTGTYNAEAIEYLKGKGYTLKNSYTVASTNYPVTWDWYNTYRAGTIEILANLADGLVEYNSEGTLVPCLAEAIPSGVYDSKTDTTTYTFQIRQGCYWAKNWNGANLDYEITADDFVAGFQHMLDTEGGLEYLGDIVVGATDYLYNDGSFSNVGVKATDKYTLEYTVNGNPTYFLTMLSYTVFKPMCREFFLECGGAFGRSEYATVRDNGTCRYGESEEDILTCGAFYTAYAENGTGVRLEKNENYWRYKDSDTTNDPRIETMEWKWFSGIDPLETYTLATSGEIDRVALNNYAYPVAVEDGNLSTYGVIEELNSTTMFQTFNLNRQTYMLENGNATSSKNVDAAKDTSIAIQNRNLRLAMIFAFDKVGWNAKSVGEATQSNRIRNTLTPYDYVYTKDEVTNGKVTFFKGTSYGMLVSYYVSQKFGFNMDLSDGQNAWYNPELASQFLSEALEELDGKLTGNHVEFDIVYMSTNSIQYEQAAYYKQCIEENLNGFVKINLVGVESQTDYYNSGYYASYGSDLNQDVFYGSGWSPDYGDPSSYLDIFLPDGSGYMSKMIGLF